MYKQVHTLQYFTATYNLQPLTNRSLCYRKMVLLLSLTIISFDWYG